MANTYLKIYLHIVFAVKNRNALLPKYELCNIHAYISRILMNQGQDPIIVGGVEDHVHILLAYSGNILISDLVKEIKLGTSSYIKKHCMMPYKFEWQRGYACLSYSHSHIDAVRNYIANQETHHKRQSMRDEICGILSKFAISYDANYIFKDPE